MILASCNRLNIVLYLSSILVKNIPTCYYLYYKIFSCNRSKKSWSMTGVTFFFDQTLNRQSNTICTHENWAPKMLARSESDTKNTFLYVDSNIVLWGKSRNSFFFCPSWKIRLEIFDAGKMMSFLVARFTIFKSQQHVIFGGKVHSFSNQTLLFGLMLKIVKKVFFVRFIFIVVQSIGKRDAVSKIRFRRGHHQELGIGKGSSSST